MPPYSHINMNAKNMKTVIKQVCRTGIGFAAVTASVPKDAAAEQIKDAILNAAGNHEFHDTDAEYQLVEDVGANSSGAGGQLLTALLSNLYGSDFQSQAAYLEALDGFVLDHADELVGLGIVPCVLTNAQEHGRYWRQKDGWGGLERATVFMRGNSPQPESSEAIVIPLAAAKALVEIDAQAGDDHSEWEGLIAGAISHAGETTTSDAQALIEVNPFIIAQSWAKGDRPSVVALKILAISAPENGAQRASEV